ncbi:MAG: glycosyltransferase [Planctomycetia bacterium]|nr:glycosyltransferase [Planctomycetia bacterium]
MTTFQNPLTTGLASAVIPTFNRAYCIARTIDSALAQTYRDTEVVVVDDGSTDGTAEMIRDRFGNEPRVRYLHQQNAGVSAARNAGMLAARGEFLALLDSDDSWHPWKLEAQIAALRRFPELGMVWTDFEAVDPEGRIVDPRHLKAMFAGYKHFSDEELFTARYPMRSLTPHLGQLNESNLYVGHVFSRMLVGALVLTSTAVFRRATVERVGLFDTGLKIGEDYDFLLRIAHEGPVGCIDAPAMQYQRGLADHHSRDEHKLLHAVNHLRTIEPYLENDRARIQLSDGQIRQMLADVHRWIGEKAVDGGQLALARKHLAKSLWQNSRQARCLGLLLVSCLPQFCGDALRNIYRRCKMA